MAVYTLYVTAKRFKLVNQGFQRHKFLRTYVCLELVTVDHKDQVWVTSTNHYVQQFTADGRFLQRVGGKGAEAGQLNEPHGIWVDTRGADPVLVVADRRNNRLQRFTLDGKHIDFVQGFRLPCHFDQQNGTVVIPDLQGRVTLIGRDNQVITHLGDSNPANWNNPLRTQPREAFVPGQFICPHGACFDHEGNIFVVEWVEVGRVTKLRKVA